MNNGQVAIIEGGLHTDDRGSLAFFNDFPLSGIKRFYIIRPREPHAVRGWVGHQREHKWFAALVGVFTVAVVQPDNWQAPAANLPVSTFVLDAAIPRILSIPPGHATAIVSGGPQTALMVFSTGKIQDSPSDTFRFPPDFWRVSEQSSEENCESF
jgi:hypothetical protein